MAFSFPYFFFIVSQYYKPFAFQWYSNLSSAKISIHYITIKFNTIIYLLLNRFLVYYFGERRCYETIFKMKPLFIFLLVYALYFVKKKKKCNIYLKHIYRYNFEKKKKRRRKNQWMKERKGWNQRKKRILFE